MADYFAVNGVETVAVAPMHTISPDVPTYWVPNEQRLHFFAADGANIGYPAAWEEL